MGLHMIVGGSTGPRACSIMIVKLTKTSSNWDTFSFQVCMWCLYLMEPDCIHMKVLKMCFCCNQLKKNGMCLCSS